MYQLISRSIKEVREENGYGLASNGDGCISENSEGIRSDRQ